MRPGDAPPCHFGGSAAGFDAGELVDGAERVGIDIDTFGTGVDAGGVEVAGPVLGALTAAEAT